MNQWGMFAIGGLAGLLLSAVVAGVIEGDWWALYDYYDMVFGPIIRKALRRPAPLREEESP